MENGKLIVISGPSGCGKGVISKLVRKKTGIPIAISATTRAPREDDIPDVTYHFITKQEFEDRIASGGMLEYNFYNGNYYGTPAKEPIEAVRAGGSMILEIDVHGGMNVRKLYPDAILIMLLAPSFSVQEKRLRGRGKTLSEEQIRERLDETRRELEKLPLYDAVVINGQNEEELCAEAVISIIERRAGWERYKVSNHPDLPKTYFEN